MYFQTTILISEFSVGLFLLAVSSLSFFFFFNLFVFLLTFWYMLDIVGENAEDFNLYIIFS